MQAGGVVRTRWISLSGAGLCALLTAAAHALVGQAHLTRILGTSVERIDSAVLFAVWHMVTVILVVSGVSLLWVARSGHTAVVRAVSLLMATLFGLFGLVFIGTSILYGEPTVQWIAMLVVSALCLVGYVSARRASES